MLKRFSQPALRDRRISVTGVYQCREQLHLTRDCRSQTPFLLSCVVVTVGMIATSVCAAEIAYDSHEIDIGEESEVFFLFTGPFTGKDKDDLVIVTRPKEQDKAESADDSEEMRRLAVYSHEDGAFSRVISVGTTARLMDTWRFKEGVALLSAHSEGIDRFDPSAGTFESWLGIVDTESQPQSTEPEFWLNFSRDLNGDNLDDIVYVVDESLVARVQLPNGDLAEPVVISSSPGLEVRSRYPFDSPLTVVKSMALVETTTPAVWQLQYSIYPIDYDGDGIGDVALPYFDGEAYDRMRTEPQSNGELDADPEKHPLVEVSGLRIHRGLDGYGWAANPITVRVPAPPMLDEQPAHLFALQDFNGDGVDDAAVFYIVGGGLSYMDFFFGHRKDGETVFRDTADTRITMTSALVMVTELSDLDGDGDVDFCAVPMKIGFGTIVSGLVRRSVRLTLSCYLMTDGVYPEAPSKQLSRRLRLNVVAPDALADVTGDGILDVVLPTRRNRLEIFAGTGDADLFADQPIKVDLDLPKGDDAILFRDLNRDGKADMLVVRTEGGKPVWVALSR